MGAIIGVVTTVAATTIRERQSGLESWVLRLAQPPLARVTTGRGTDIMDQHMARAMGTTATRIRIDAAITIHIDPHTRHETVNGEAAKAASFRNKGLVDQDEDGNRRWARPA